MMINPISYNISNPVVNNKPVLRQNPSMTGKFPSAEPKVSRLKRFLYRFFNKKGHTQQDKFGTIEPVVKTYSPKRTYKTRAMTGNEIQAPTHINIVKTDDAYDIKVKDVYSNGVLVDKVYGKYLTDSYWRVRYESTMPAEARGSFNTNNGRKMQFKSGYGQNFRKSDNKAITVYYNKNSNTSGILKTYTSNSGDVEIELYKDINNGNYERRISKKVNSLLKSDIYCVRDLPELLVIYEKPGDFNGTRYMYKFNNKSERIYRNSLVNGELKRDHTLTYQNVLENPDAYPIELFMIVNRNLRGNSNKELISNLINLK